MTKKISIKKCINDDFLGILKLLKQLWPKHNFITKDVKKSFNNALKSSNQHYFCAIIKKDIVGFGSFSIKNGLYAMGKVAILDELIIDDKHRNMGIAKQLVDFMINFAKKNKCVCVELECGSERITAHNFYEKYGFDKGNGYFFSIDLIKV